MDGVPDHDALAEYHAARDAVGIADRSDLGVVEGTGRDRAKFLHALLSNDIAALAAGQGCAATLLDVHGKVQVTLVVLALDDRLLLLTPPGMGESTVAALDHYLFAEKAALEDVTGQRAVFMLVGPAAPASAKRLTGAASPEAPWSHVAASLDGRQMRVIRGGGETGQPEVWLLVPAEARESAWKAALAAGAPPPGPAGPRAPRLQGRPPPLRRGGGAPGVFPEVPAGPPHSLTKGCD